MFRKDVAHLVVRVGEYSLLEVDPDQAELHVKRIILHEDYDPETVENDICMLELESEADLSSPNIGTLSLPFQGEEYEEGTLCTVIGWGSLEEGGYLSMILQKVDLNPDIVESDIRP